MTQRGPSHPPQAVPLQPIPLQQLRLMPLGCHWEVDQHLSALTTLTPVRGTITALHGGSVLEVSGAAHTIITLCCDRCLRHYNQPIAFKEREPLWIGEAEPSELDDDPLDGPCERLDPQGSFDPAHWLFEQLSLQWPLRNHCGPDCPGPASWGTHDAAPIPDPASQDGGAIDPRWARLRELR